MTPATDDRPFFFNYFKLSKVFSASKDFRDYRLGEYLPNFPVGHMVLLSSLAIIAVMAFVLIILPLRFLKKRNERSGLKTRTFLYFCSLGIGFMFIEICMMQKFILFLGHPIYSMSVVLGGILAFSGFGALASSRFATPNRSLLTKLLLLINALAIFNAFGLSMILQPLQDTALNIRIIVTVLLLAPTAFVLGFPFPLGVKMLKNSAPQLIPWGWAINGFLSVLSSIVAITLAMVIGFTWVLLSAGLVYAIGLTAAPIARITAKKRVAA